jgi:hypothetical protein
MVWFGLWCLTPLSTLFPLYRGDQFIMGKRNSVREIKQMMHAICWSWAYMMKVIPECNVDNLGNDETKLNEDDNTIISIIKIHSFHNE